MVGVLIVVCNQERFVQEALNSIAAQTLPPEQVVFVDNGSTDRTGEIARAAGVEVIRTPALAQAGGRNVGLRAMRTEYVAFLDGDDRFAPDHHRLLLDAIEDRDAVGGLVREFYDPEREQELAKQFAISEQPVAGVLCAMLVRRSAIERIGGFTEDPTEHDAFRFVNALGEVPTIDEVVLERRIHGENFTIVNREEVQRSYLRSARRAILERRAGGE